MLTTITFTTTEPSRVIVQYIKDGWGASIEEPMTEETYSLPIMIGEEKTRVSLLRTDNASPPPVIKFMTAPAYSTFLYFDLKVGASLGSELLTDPAAYTSIENTGPLYLNKRMVILFELPTTVGP
jgi:hypothetical protein